ncbi:MAG TPA: hypothetical protein VND66_14740 [Acidobacteriaceae bacterium]|nr:hypothetical protein [Acidobacteriaceae bacterium]
MRTTAANMIGGRHQLELGFNRARPSHGDKAFATDLEIEYLDDGLPVLRVLQAIRSFGEPLLPNFAHPLCSVSGEAEALDYRDHPSNASTERWGG